MSLSSELVSQLVKATLGPKETSKETTVRGTTVVDGKGKTWVKLDGSELLTPIDTTTDVKGDERVTVMIKDHKATVTGNLSSPSARTDDVKEQGKQIAEFDIIMAHRVSTDDITAINATIDNLKAKVAAFENIEAATAKIETLEATYASLTHISASDIKALNAQIESIQATFGEFTDISAEDLEALNAEITNLKGYNANFTYVSAEKLSAVKAEIDSAYLKFVQIDFANIGQADFENFYAKSGMVEYLTTDGQVVTGTLVGVTIKGDVIDAGTIVADKLVFRGEDGLYYKLNTEAFTDAEGNVLGEGEYELTDENGINGRVIVAKSITAEKVSVSDLVAFNATVGGMNLREDALYSGVKDGVGNTTPGFYLDKDGQVNFGDGNNYLKFFKDEDGVYHLAIAADTVLYSINGSQHSLSDFGALGEYVRIGKYGDKGEPCIELGQSGTDFKMVITNQRILFMEGTNTPAYMTNQSLFIEKAVINQELQQGDFVWQARLNGNLGLMWKGVTTNGYSH